MHKITLFKVHLWDTKNALLSKYLFNTEVKCHAKMKSEPGRGIIGMYKNH